MQIDKVVNEVYEQVWYQLLNAVKLLGMIWVWTIRGI